MSTNAKNRKTDAARQKALYERRKSNGWRKTWVDPGTLDVAKRLGGIENIADNLAALQAENDLLKRNAEGNVRAVSQLGDTVKNTQEKAKELQSKLDEIANRTFWQKLRDALSGTRS